jgi:hypothetical protein
MQLTSYGKNAGFVNECMRCHKPMKDEDYVFTIPLEYTPTGQLVTTTYDRNQKTMSAVYQQDSLITRIVWQQRDDPHWFGGRIPGGKVSVEVVNDTAMRRLIMP